MPISTRRQTAEFKKQHERQQSQRDARLSAVELLRLWYHSIRQIVGICGISKTTVKRFKHDTDRKNEKDSCCLTIDQCKRDRKPIITSEKSHIINQRLKEAAEEGFAFDSDQFRSVLSKVAAGGRPGYKNAIPSAYEIRFYRAQNRKIADKKVKNKEHAKSEALIYDHVEAL